MGLPIPQQVNRVLSAQPTVSELVLIIIINPGGGNERYVFPVEMVDSWIKLLDVVQSIYRGDPFPRVFLPGMFAEVSPAAWPLMVGAGHMYYINLEVSLYLRIETFDIEFSGPKSIDVPKMAFTSTIADVTKAIHEKLEVFLERDQLRISLMDFWGDVIPGEHQLTRYSYRNRCCITCRLDRL